MKGVHVKRTRMLAVALSLAAVIGIPGAAAAQGGPTNCIGKSVQQLHTTFMGLAQSEPGAVGDMIAWIRDNPDALPWCG
jgi:hypothetical protein